MPCLLPLATISWTALPAVALALYFGVGLVLFVLRSRRQGMFRDAEMAERGASVDAWFGETLEQVHSFELLP